MYKMHFGIEKRRSHIMLTDHLVTAILDDTDDFDINYLIDRNLQVKPNSFQANFGCFI